LAVVNVVNNCDGTSTLSTTATGTLLWSAGTPLACFNNCSRTAYRYNNASGCTGYKGSGVSNSKTTPTAPVVNVVNN
jgi:hypothetical protein